MKAYTPKTVKYRYFMKGRWTGDYECDIADFRKLWKRIAREVEMCLVWEPEWRYNDEGISQNFFFAYHRDDSGAGHWETVD